MINFLSSWAEQIIVAIVIGSIIEMILPNNKTKKYIKMVIGIYILFNIISPFINKKDFLDLNNFESYVENEVSSEKTMSAEEVNQESMDERLQSLYVDELENNVKAKVEEQGYSVKECNVDAVLNENDKNKGINKISLKASKKQADADAADSAKNDVGADVRTVNKVEINVGLDKFNEDDGSGKNDADGLKQVLSDFYQIDKSKIQVEVK